MFLIAVLICHFLLIVYALGLAFLTSTFHRLLVFTFLIGPVLVAAIYYFAKLLLPREVTVAVLRNLLFIILYAPAAIVLRIFISRNISHHEK